MARRADGYSDIQAVCWKCKGRWQTVGYAPQPGPQASYFETTADIAIYGGAAGSGKTYAITVEPLRYVGLRDFKGIIFRRTATQIVGGIWDETLEHYPNFGGKSRADNLTWKFGPRGTWIKLGHLQYESNKLDHQGKEYAYIGFDELTHFTEGQFWYLVSRNRSKSGVRPYIRATCNPVHREHPVGGWVRNLIDWWIGADGKPIPERSGVIRWFVRVDDRLVWGDSRKELEERFPLLPKVAIKSLTFISASLDDNKILEQLDPGYRGNLLALPRVERERLLGGNWNVSPAAGLYFQRSWFEIMERRALHAVIRIRGWDLAASKPTPENPDPDWTRGVLLALDRKGKVWIEDVVSLRGSPGKVRELIRHTAEMDGKSVKQCFWQDPGQAGKDQVSQIRALLFGYATSFVVAKESKISYAEPFSAQAEGGNVVVVRGDWNASFFAEAEGFPDGSHDDQIDGAARAFLELDKPGVDLYRRAMRNLV